MRKKIVKIMAVILILVIYGGMCYKDYRSDMDEYRPTNHMKGGSYQQESTGTSISEAKFPSDVRAKFVCLTSTVSGNLSIHLLDPEGKKIAELDPNGTREIRINKSGTYMIKVEERGFKGTYTVSW